MKRQYIKPIFEVVQVDTENIMAASGTKKWNDVPDYGPGFEEGWGDDDW